MPTHAAPDCPALPACHASLPTRTIFHRLSALHPLTTQGGDAGGTHSLMARGYRIAIAARQGRGLEARILRGKDPSCKWTHLGLAFAPSSTETWSVVHADPGRGHDGHVRHVLFAEFAAHGVCARLIPLPVANVETAARLRNEALRHVGMPFDGSYDWTRTDAMYCTSLLWRIFNMVGIPAPQPPFPSFALPMFGARELILPSLFTQHIGEPCI